MDSGSIPLTRSTSAINSCHKDVCIWRISRGSPAISEYQALTKGLVPSVSAVVPSSNISSMYERFKKTKSSRYVAIKARSDLNLHVTMYSNLVSVLFVIYVSPLFASSNSKKSLMGVAVGIGVGVGVGTGVGTAVNFGRALVDPRSTITRYLPVCT